MKKTMISLLLAALMLFGCVACAGTAPETTDAPKDSGTEPPATDEPAAPATDAPTEPETTEAPAAPAEIPKSLKVLAIGNSFSTDCMEYLWKMLKSLGVQDITLGNLYYGGCTLAQHLSFATGDKPEYTYYKSTKGPWVTTKSYKMSQALKDEDWDIITMQESSKTSGVASAYKASLSKLIDYVRAGNSTATLIWNMTWAYQQDSTHSSFPNYGRDQMKMYNMIIDCTKNYVQKDGRYSKIIPTGTAIQNARTSYLGDHITRDGYHLNKDFGRYLAAMTWACLLTGADPDAVTYNPSSYVINEDMVAVAKESVRNALATPLAVTESQIKTGKGTLAEEKTEIDPTEILNAADFYEADKGVANDAGLNLDGYTLLDWEYLENTYWNCTSKPGTTTPGSSGGTYHQNVCSQKKFSLEEVPEGSLFFCDAGWQYRLELYNNTTDTFNGTRPAMSSAKIFVLDKEFLSGASYIAWNIASAPKSDISAIYAQAAVHMRVYVPKK